MAITKTKNGFGVIKLIIEPKEIPGLLERHTENYEDISQIETEGTALIQDDFPAMSSKAFMKSVCEWGRGHRNLSRVLTHNSPKSIADALREGHKLALQGDVSGGVIRIANLKRLGISYASKQLRVLLPNQAVILDSVIRIGLGYAESKSGYDAFLGDCSELLTHLQKAKIPAMMGRPKLRICDVEAALFQKLKES